MEELDKDMASSLQGNRVYVYLITLLATVGGFIFGFDTLIVAGASVFLKEHFSLSPAQVGFAVGSALLGCLAGSLIAGVLSGWLGRKRTMMLAAILFAVSAVGTALPRTVFEFNAYRICGGVGVGVAMLISPMYISEIAPARIRGRLVTLMQFTIVFGAFLAFVVSYLLSFTESWRWMFASECLPIAILAMGLIFVPESPRWLVEKGRKQEAFEVLTAINGSEQAEKEVEEIAASIAEETGTFSELFATGVRGALIIAIGLAVFQQICGGYALTVYAPMIFMKAGFPDPSEAIGLTVFLQTYNLLIVALVLWIVERVGRKPLLLFGMSGMAIGHMILWLCFRFDWWGFYVPLTVVLTTGFSNLSISPLAWVIMPEIFPTRVRGKGMAIATFVLWASCYATSQWFPPLAALCEKKFGTPGEAFLVFGLICILGVVFVWRMVPETKGKTLEEIASFWLHKKDRL